ncbi:hypothetical protein BVC71_14430 [Marivivens niveibacter]|uniref:Xylose isomerase-like TIM barrel domain-containing protein n=1 Tax=Marivivens niveibacter TaxID=1930667 RepID=A0A251WVT4_9RHOB|nr:TIM barrel protein [Marivivens niveibacter]OUD08371.1 hypothetical protein BVC71_14430 [Marivivens niveibacter]
MIRALNQKTCRTLSFPDYLDIAVATGCGGIEVRNDLGRPTFDGMDPANAKALIAEKGLRLFGVSEVYGFNVWSEEIAQQITDLAQLAEAAGAETVSLIPTVDDRPTLTIRETLRELMPIFRGLSVKPLIEPIGFETSSIKGKADLVAAIDEVAPEMFAIVHDTFQHTIANEDEIYPDHTAMVHISGISDPQLALDSAADAHRVFVNPDDRSAAIPQIRSFIERGYKGAFSFECTEPAVIDIDNGDLIRGSFEWIESQI